jgi:acyl CoA:acetate/3-ketoacid CoA transferase
MELLDAIFADNVVTAEERQQLVEYQADLEPAAVARVFKAFVEQKRGEALADGVVTKDEKLILRRVIEELEVPESALPPRLRLLMRAR